MVLGYRRGIPCQLVPDDDFGNASRSHSNTLALQHQLLLAGPLPSIRTLSPRRRLHRDSESLVASNIAQSFAN